MFIYFKYLDFEKFKEKYKKKNIKIKKKKIK